MRADIVARDRIASPHHARSHWFKDTTMGSQTDIVRQNMARLSDEELLTVLTTAAADYTPEALSVAQHEAEQRGGLARVRAEAELRRQAGQAHAREEAEAECSRAREQRGDAMKAQERLKKVVETLKTEPIEVLSAETWAIGWSFVWRQAILFAPGYAFIFWAELDRRGFERLIPNEPWVLLAVPLFLLYWVYSLGAAEALRSKGTIPSASVAEISGTLKRGASLWWRIFAAMVRLIWVAFIVALLSLAIGGQAATVLLVIVQCILLVPMTGLGVRHWLRSLRVEAEARGRPLASAGVCNLCGLPMRVESDGGEWIVSASSSLITLRCDRCDITSAEKREDLGGALGAAG